MDELDPRNWSIDCVAAFVRDDLPDFDGIAETLLENDVDGEVLLTLTDDDLKKDLGITSLGKRKKLLKVIEKLKKHSPTVLKEQNKFAASVQEGATATGCDETTSNVAAEDPRQAFHSDTFSHHSSAERALTSHTTTETRRSDSDSSMDMLSSFAMPPLMPGSEKTVETGPRASEESSLPLKLAATPNRLPVATSSGGTVASAFSLTTDKVATPVRLKADLEDFSLKEEENSSTAMPLTMHKPTSEPVTRPLEAGVSTLETRETDEVMVIESSETDDITRITTDLAKLTVKQELRTYQKELLDKVNKSEVNGHNAVICAPTGSGKTLVGASHCADVITKARATSADAELKECIYFVVPTVHLVDQQAKYIRETIINCRVGQISGNQTEATTLCEQMRINDVVVMTPAILVNALKERDSEAKLSDVSLLVLDECHHTEKDHPYMQIMNFYLNEKYENTGSKGKLPRVLGMTATLGVGSVSTQRDAESHVLTLLANLDSTELLQVTENCDELYEYVPHPDTTLLSVGKRPIDDPFFLETGKIMTDLQRKAGMTEKPYEHGSHEFETVINQHRVSLEEMGDHEALFHVNMLITYNRGLQVYHHMRKEEMLDFLQREFSKRNAKPESDSKLVVMMKNALELNTDQLQKLKTVRSECNPKVEALKKFLLAEFIKSKKAKGIVFVKTREFTTDIVKWIREDLELSPLVNPRRLVGGGGESRDHMSKPEQLMAIRTFAEGNCNLLVATTIGEEGLDIPECNFVIRYETVTSEVAEVQARGRARVRLQSSRFVEIVTRGSANEEHARANKYREQLMNEACHVVTRMHKTELLNEITKRQMERLKKLGQRARQLQAKRWSNKASDAQLVCKFCGVRMCHGTDILRVETYHVVTGDCLAAKMRVDHQSHSPSADHGKVGTIYCKSCGGYWGVMKKFGNGRELPSLKCKSIRFIVAGESKFIPKQWKDVPFAVQEGTEDDL